MPDMDDDDGSPKQRRDGPNMRAKRPADQTPGRCEVLDALSDEECLLATPWVVGFDLKTQDWGEFEEVRWYMS